MAKILVVDDEENIRNVFKRALEKEQHEVIVASNGRIAESLFHDCIPDIIILDIIMPEQEGIETLLKLKAHRNNIKVIAISGGGMGKATNYLDNALKLGANIALAKPVKIDVLIYNINLLLKY